MTLTNGNKTATITNTTDGYNDKVIIVRITQKYYNGIERTTRFIASRTFKNEKVAEKWAKNQINY